MNTSTERPTALIKRRVKNGTAQTVAFCFFFGGIYLLLFLSPPLGLLAMLLGLVVDAFRTVEHTCGACGACGNHVASTSTLCPTCHITLEPPPSPWPNRLLSLGLIALVVIGGILLRRWMLGTL
jgi:hypothetical protein